MCNIIVMDATAISLMKIFNGNMGYVIYSVSELTEQIGCDGESIRATINNLLDGNYIDVRYSRGDFYCLAVLKCYAETQNAIAENETPDKKIYLIYALFAFLGAFIGGIFAQIIISAVN